MKKQLLNMLMVCFGLVCAVEAVTIENVTARQRYPWNGKVDISFDVVGNPAANLSVGKVAKLAVTMMDRTTRKSYEAENVTGDIEPTEGLHHVVWDLTAQGIEVYSTNAVFAVAYEEKDSEEKDSTYRVIDVSGGAMAERYPVTYLDAVPTGGWSDEYKTDKIVLRRIDKPSGTYYAGVFEITEAQWNRVMGGTGTSTHPAVTSYDEIDSFMSELRRKTGLLSFDLPTGAEWEYAARAGVTTKWLCGDSETGIDDYAWYEANSDGTVHPVGTRRANAWGLYDVHGNVWEWTSDWGNSEGIETDSDFESGVFSSVRVLRGGSRGGEASDCAFAYGDYYARSDAHYGRYVRRELDQDNSNCHGFRLFYRPESK